MVKLNKKEKIEIISKMKKSGWTGCNCDNCLLKLAELVLNYQLKHK